MNILYSAFAKLFSAFAYLGYYMRKAVDFGLKSEPNDRFARAMANVHTKIAPPTAAKKKYGASNAMLQMDDFLSLAREPVVAKKSEPSKEVKKVEEKPIVEPKKTEPEDENAKEKLEAEENFTIQAKYSESDKVDENGKPKKKLDRNAVLAPKPPKENLKKKERYLKKKEEEKKEQERKKIEEAERLAAEAAKLAIKETPPEPEPEPEPKERRLNEIVQEYLVLAPVSDKHRARNSPFMNIVHDLVSLDRTVNDFKRGKGKEDKAFIKTDENLTKCLIRFDSIERNNEVLGTTIKLLINHTQKLIQTLENKAMDTSAPEVSEPTKPNKKYGSEEKKISESKERVDEQQIESTPSSAVTVGDVKVEEANGSEEANSNAGLSIEEILKKKGKTKKKKKN